MNYLQLLRTLGSTLHEADRREGSFSSLKSYFDFVGLKHAIKRIEMALTTTSDLKLTYDGTDCCV